MAIKQIVPIEITLIGDGSSTTFTLPLANMYQNGTGSSVPVGALGIVPSSIAVSNTPVAITSATIDSYGNITITLTTALGNNVQATMEVDLYYSSGAITSTSTNPTQAVNVQSSGTAITNTGGSLNVNITGGSSGNGAASATGSAVPSQADYQGVKVGSNLVGVTGFTVGSSTGAAVAIIDGSGNQITSFGGGTQYASGATAATPTGTVAMGQNGTAVYAIQTDATGNLYVKGTLTNNNAAPATATNVGALSSIASWTGAAYAQGNVVMPSVDLTGAVRVNIGSDADMFGQLVATTRFCQWQQNFSGGADATLLTPTATGSGTATYGSGGLTLATGAAGTSSENVTSTVALEYRVAHEWYILFTAKFTTGVANSHQRIGFWNGAANTPQDGFFIGYEGTTFGITQFQNSTGQGSYSANSAPSIAKSSMNGDALGGAAGSVFTSSGSPVAWAATSDNLYRLRGGWLGTGVVVLEILSPDGLWVPMHTFHFPNTLANSYTYTTTWNYQAEALNTSNTSNVTLYLGGAVFGTTDPTHRTTDVINGQSNGVITISTLQGQYLSSAPTVSTSGNYNALQIDTNANLKINDATTDVSQATINITAADVASTSTTVADGQAFITGSPTANSAASFAINGESEVHLQMTGTLVGTVVIEASQDGGTTWVARPVRLDGVNYITSSITGASSPLTNFIGHCTAAALTNIRVRCTTFTSGTGTVLLRSSNFSGSTVVLNPLVLRDATTQSNTVGVVAKGTQGGFAATTQDLKDSGRTYISVTVDLTAGITTEALATCIQNKGGTTASATNFTVTTGKTFRITSFNYYVRGTTTTAAGGEGKIRAAGTVAATSPIVALVGAGMSAAVATAAASAQLAFPDGMEIASGQQYGLTHLDTTTACSVSMCMTGFEY